MVNDYFSEEFRNFKFLQSSPKFVDHKKLTRLKFNQVRPKDQVDNEEFAWSSRIEFIEQILDLKDSEIYVVEPGEAYRTGQGSSIDYNLSKLHVIRSPRIIRNHLITPDYKEVTFDDIPVIEDDTDNFAGPYFLTTKQSVEMGPHSNVIIISLSHLCLLPHPVFSYAALFYDQEEAEKYRDALTSFMRKYSNAVSAISNLF